MVELTQGQSSTAPVRASRGLVDGCGRRIDHLRVAVTSACDLRCVYCRPEADGVPGAGRRSGLSDEQRVDFVRFLHDRYGLSQVRITGGEPLTYPGVVAFVASLRRAVPHLRMAMTTNARLLYHKGFELRRAGLDRLNVSLDSLDPQRYRRITGGDLDAVLTGLDSARVVGFPPPRINTVVLRGVNDDELVELAEWAMSRGSELRFLEAMPIGPAAEENRDVFVSAETMKATLSEHFSLEALPYAAGETARRFALSRGRFRGVVGIISPVSDSFCGGCRRIRLTADGRLFPCLLDDRSMDVAPLWTGARFQPEAAEKLIECAVAGKQPQGSTQRTSMIQLGG